MKALVGASNKEKAQALVENSTCEATSMILCMSSWRLPSSVTRGLAAALVVLLELSTIEITLWNL